MRFYAVVCAFLFAAGSASAGMPEVAPADVIFLATFDKGFDATFAAGSPTAEVVGTPALVEGKTGQGACFSNATLVSYDAGGNWDAPEGTLSLWVKPAWNMCDYRPHCFVEVPVMPLALLDGGFVLTKGFANNNTPNQLMFYFSPGHNNGSAQRKTLFSEAEWTHLLCTWSVSNKTMALYVNGRQEVSVPLRAGSFFPGGKGRRIYVGARMGGSFMAKPEDVNVQGQILRHFPDTGDCGADAVIDELVIWKRALTLDEIQKFTGVAPKDPWNRGFASGYGFDLAQAPETPHTPWCKPRAGGRIKALVLAECFTHRETVELAERLDLDVTAVALPVLEPKQEGFAYALEVGRELASGDYDVIVLGSVYWDFIDVKSRQALVDRVLAGRPALVYISPRHTDETLRKQLFSLPRADDGGFIASGSPVGGLPLLEKGNRGLWNPEEVPQPDSLQKDFYHWIDLRSKDRARVAVLRYQSGLWRSGMTCSLTPRMAEAGDFNEIMYDYWQSLLAKSVVWAAHGVPQVRFAGIRAFPSVSISAADLGSTGITVSVENGAAESSAGVWIRIRDKEGRVRFEETRKMDVKPGQSGITVKASDLAEGGYFVDLILKGQQGMVLDWAALHLNVSSDISASGVVLNKNSCRPGEMVKGEVTLLNRAAQAAAGLNLAVNLHDSRGRWVSSMSKPIALGPSETRRESFELKVEDTLGNAATIKAEVERNGKALAWASETIPVRKGIDWTDFHFLASVAYGGYDYIPLLAMRIFRDQYGLDAAWFGADSAFEPSWRKRLMFFARENLYVCPTLWNVGYTGPSKETQKKDERGNPVRDTCLSDPAYLEGMRNRLRPWAEELGRYDVYAYNFGDENKLGPPGTQVCFSKTCVANLADWCRKTYGTIDRLNAQWSTTFKDWSEIYPTTINEVRSLKEPWEKRNLSHYIDFRMNMETVFANVFKNGGNAVHPVVPDARTSIEGTFGLRSYRGYDIYKLMNALDCVWTYGDMSGRHEQSFTRAPDAFRGWWWCYSDNVEDEARSPAWDMLFHQSRAIAWYNIWEFNFYSAMAPDFTPGRNWAWAAEEVRDVMSGVGRLLSNLDQQKPVAIHYSQESFHAAHVQGMAHVPDYHLNACLLLEDLATPSRFVASEQIEQGALKGYKVLILPRSECLSDAVAGAVLDFVEVGGVVIAFGPAGLRDGHGKPRGSGALDAILSGGQAQSSGDCAWRVRKAGKGAGITLEKPDVTCYQQLRARGRGADLPLREMMSAALRQAQVSPAIRVESPEGGPLSAVEIFPFRDGSGALYAGLLRSPGAPGPKAAPAVVFGPEEHFAYNVRTKEYLGRGKAALSLQRNGRGEVVAFLPCRLSAIKTACDKTSYHRGETLQINLQPEFDGTNAVLGTRVMRLDFTGPDGQAYRPYLRTILIPGKIENPATAQKLALDETRGKWSVKVTDISTGVSGAAGFTVE